jgi:hypothetical protein
VSRLLLAGALGLTLVGLGALAWAWIVNQDDAGHGEGE